MGPNQRTLTGSTVFFSSSGNIRSVMPPTTRLGAIPDSTSVFLLPAILKSHLKMADAVGAVSSSLHRLVGIIDHCPQLTPEGIRAALACAAELAHEGLWKTAVGA